MASPLGLDIMLISNVQHIGTKTKWLDNCSHIYTIGTDEFCSFQEYLSSKKIYTADHEVE